MNWPKGNLDKELPTVECLEIENYGGCEQRRFIPVDFPFFEEVQVIVATIKNKMGSDEHRRRLDTYGLALAEKKWGQLGEPHRTKALNEIEKERSSEGESTSGKYDMIFIRGLHPCFRLEFTSAKNMGDENKRKIVKNGLMNYQSKQSKLSYLFTAH